MKILFCHNHYQRRGGEDESYAGETRLLESHGHEVVHYTVHNDEIEDLLSLDVAARTIWSRRSHAQVRELIRWHHPDVMHCQNTFPLISSSVYYAARAESVPVVQTLRNYRLLCPNALFLRNK